MGNLFNGNSFKHLIGSYLQDLTITPDNAICNLSEAVKRLQTELLAKSQGVTGCLNCLLFSSEFFSDDFIDSGEKYQRTINNFVNAVGIRASEWFADLRDSLDSISIEEEVAEETVKTVTVIDSAGHAYKLKIEQGAISAWNGSEWIELIVYPAPEVIVFHEQLASVTGQVYCLWDVVTDLVRVNNMNNALIELCNCATSNVTNVSGLLAGLIALTTTVSAEAVSVVRAAMNAFATGGKVGLFKYILTYYQALTTVEDKVDHMEFTDNSGLIPQYYIAGIISIAGTALTAISTVIAATCSKVVGAAGVLFGTLISAVSTALQQDYSDTYARLMSQNEDVDFNGAPYGLFQSTWSLTPEAIPAVIRDGSTYAFRVPGGYLLVGPSGHGRSYNIEFHPDLVNRVTAVKELLEDNNFMFYTRGETTLYRDGDIYTYLDYDHWPEYDEIVACGNSASGDDPVNDIDNSNDAQGLLAHDAQLTQRILTANAALFLLMIFKPGEYTEHIVSYNAWRYENILQGISLIQLTGDTLNANSKLIIDFLMYAYVRIQSFEMIYATEYVYNMSWKEFVEFTFEKLQDIKDDYDSQLIVSGFGAFFVFRYGQGLVVYDSARLVWLLKIPKYDQRSFIATIAIGTAATIAVTAVTAFVAFKAARAIRNKRLQNSIAVQNAYEVAQKNPTQTNMDAYFHAVRKNNIWTTLIGGHTYSKTDFWFGDTSNSSTWYKSFFNESPMVYTNNKTIDDIFRLIKGSL